jgi:hypothetical protein
MREEFVKRNVEITVKVLNGQSLRKTGEEYHLTAERIRQIFTSTVKHHIIPKSYPFRSRSFILKDKRYRRDGGTFVINALREIWDGEQFIKEEELNVERR